MQQIKPDMTDQEVYDFISDTVQAGIVAIWRQVLRVNVVCPDRTERALWAKTRRMIEAQLEQAELGWGLAQIRGGYGGHQEDGGTDQGKATVAEG
jgi:hypothetical protein